MIKHLKIEIFNGKKFSFIKLIKLLLFNLNVRFIFFMRLYFWLKKKRHYFLANIINNKIIKGYGCYIGKNAKIGLGTKFPHPTGIVIGSETIIGENCIIFQQVTFGGKIIGDAQQGNYPKIGNNVIIFSGAKLLGDVKIGDNVIIGANSVVLRDVPAYSVVAGVPAKNIKKIDL